MNLYNITIIDPYGLVEETFHWTVKAKNEEKARLAAFRLYMKHKGFGPRDEIEPVEVIVEEVEIN